MEAYIVAAFSAAGAGLIAWGGFKASLNGTKARVTQLETESNDISTRLARLEGKIDTLLERY